MKKLFFVVLILNTLLLPSIASAVSLKDIRKIQTLSFVEVEQTTDSKEEQDGKKSEEAIVSEHNVNVIIKNQKTEEFVKNIGEQAREIAHQHDLYTSVMIAQAILESKSGDSLLANAPYHNLFGIKGDFEGATVRMNTQEDDGKGNMFVVNSEFCQYPSYSESLKDYAELMKNGIAGNSDFYKGTWKSETNNYMEVTSFLTGKYATDIQYADKLNQLIDCYDLTIYDVDPVEKNTVDTIQAKKIIRIETLQMLINENLKERTLQKRKKKIEQFTNELYPFLVLILKCLRN
ncbi:glucosaminidase domain-containing protein [Enterococcus sp. AZ126]|uniref:glucosaminidase domain-containing protein n=1 Tax=Enterococcus sp. AZ126 TaxID=2774635 RepID=UPI003F262342